MHTSAAATRLKVLASSVAATVALLALPLGGTPVAAASNQPASRACTSKANDVRPLQLGKVTGIYSMPAKAPQSLVVMAHGYRNNSSSWKTHLLEARQHGAAAVAVDYRGLGAKPNYVGWPAMAGSRDLVTAAQYMLQRCPSIKKVVLVGVSMGGNMSGLALAADAKRPHSSKALFDYWVDVEGVTNWNETWAGASALAAGSAYAAQAAKDIQAECGGKTPAENPSCYQARTVTARIADIAKSGVRGIAVVHGVEDGLVPSDQSREFVTAARANSIKTDIYNVVRRDPNDKGQSGQTTAISQGDPNADCTGGGNGSVNGVGSGVCDPFAGHGWEGSSTQIVIKTGMNVVWGFLTATPTNPGNRECLVDAVSQPTPACSPATL